MARFIASLLIMGYHRFLIGIPAWGNNYVWVEYFFILSGYFAMMHVDKLGGNNEPGKEAVCYTIKKFAAFFPYVLLSVFIRYFLDAWPLFVSGEIKGALITFAYMPFESIYLSVSGILGGSDGRMAQIWYLSAMFITLPILCYMVCRYRDAWKVIAWIVPILYYGQHGMRRGFPEDVLRAFSAMAIGTLCYSAVKKLREYDYKRWQKGVLTGIEIAAFLFSLWVTCGGKSFVNLLLLSFPLTAILSLSQCTYSAVIRGRFWTFLAKLSLSIFLFHWDVGTVLRRIDMPVNMRYFLYYVITILVGLVVVFIIEALKSPFKKFCEKVLPVKREIHI